MPQRAKAGRVAAQWVGTGTGRHCRSRVPHLGLVTDTVPEKCDRLHKLVIHACITTHISWRRQRPRTKEFDVNIPNTAVEAQPSETAEATSDTRPGGRAAALLITTLVLAVLSFQLNASMITPALPHIGSFFGETPEAVAQVQSMFFLAGAISGKVIEGRSKFSGRRTGLLLVLAIMGAGTVLCIFPPNLPLLVT